MWKHTDAEALLPGASGLPIGEMFQFWMTRPGRKSLCRCSGQLGFRRVLCRWSTWIPKSHSDSEELNRDHMQFVGLPNEFVDSHRLDSVCLPRFFKAPTGYPKNRLEYLCLISYDISYVLCLMIYLMSYDLCLMSHLMSYVICSGGFGLCLAFRT